MLTKFNTKDSSFPIIAIDILNQADTNSINLLRSVSLRSDKAIHYQPYLIGTLFPPNIATAGQGGVVPPTATPVPAATLPPTGGGATTVTTQTFSCDNVTTIPKAECQALVDLYNSTGGDQWTLPAGSALWFTNNDPCS